MARRLPTRVLKNKGYGRWGTAAKAPMPLMQHLGIGRLVRHFLAAANIIPGLTITQYRALTFHKDRSKMKQIKERYGTQSLAHTSTATTRSATPSQLTMAHHPRTGFSILEIGGMSNTPIRTRDKIRSLVFRKRPSIAVGPQVLGTSSSTVLRCVPLEKTRFVLSVRF